MIAVPKLADIKIAASKCIPTTYESVLKTALAAEHYAQISLKEPLIFGRKINELSASSHIQFNSTNFINPLIKENYVAQETIPESEIITENEPTESRNSEILSLFNAINFNQSPKDNYNNEERSPARDSTFVKNDRNYSRDRNDRNRSHDRNDRKELFDRDDRNRSLDRDDRKRFDRNYRNSSFDRYDWESSFNPKDRNYSNGRNEKINDRYRNERS